MPRNFHRRVEVMAPIEDPVLRGRLMEILSIEKSDSAKAWTLDSSGGYVRVKPQGAPMRSQQRFAELARDKAKVADQASRAMPSRFHMNPSAQRSPLEGKVPRATRRRPRREDQGS